MAYVSVHVDLDEFDESEIVEHLESCGYTVTKTRAADDYPGWSGRFDADAISHIDTLLLCGQRAAALEYVSDLICAETGRRL